MMRMNRKLPGLLIGAMDGGSLERRVVRLLETPWAKRWRVVSAGVCVAVMSAACVGLMGFGVRPAVVEAAAGPMLEQSAASSGMRFDAASVKLNRSGTREGMWGCRGTDGKTLSVVKGGGFDPMDDRDIPMGRCVVRNTPLRWVIAMAYGVPWDLENQVILGGPDFISGGMDASARFDIDAEADHPVTRAQLLAMLQTLLAERFQMKIHEEMRPLQVFELTVAKGGPRLAKAPADRDCSVVPAGEPRCHDFTGANGLTGRSVSMAEFASRLSRYPGHIVVERRNLVVLYDVQTGEFWVPFPDAKDPGTPTLFHMLEDKFGLQLKAAKDPVRVLVVDSAQKLTEN